jgi:hypothetical protein
MKNPEYSFMSEHPQYLTHRAKMQPKTENMVPNFVPNCLPRSDSGDREHYCCTMITFFKPWRKGNDLKPEANTWDNIFIKHEFSKHQINIMKFFNVRYECLDAQDDFYAK